MFITQSSELRGQPSVHLTQTMRLLELSTADLAAEVVQELETNPALQLIDERRCPECGRRVRALPCPACLSKRDPASSDPIVFLSTRLPGPARDPDAADDFPEESIPQRQTLVDHIFEQVACAVDETHQQIAANILDRLDDRGLLTETPADLALALRVSLESVERMIRLIQRADPPGVAARDLQDCLLIQTEVLQETSNVHPLVQPILTRGWELLTKRSFTDLARLLHAPLSDVHEACHFIRRNLTPYPARAWTDASRGTRPAARDVFYQPDIIITHNPRPGGPLIVEVFSGMGGTLRVDPGIRASLSRLPPEDKAEWSEYIERGTFLIKCAQQRNNTMRRFAEIITTEQKAFIVGGDADLKPLTRSALALRLDLAESTVSRAVANKCAALPSGRIVPLSMFFDRSLAVRDAVHCIIRDEPPAAPFSDTKIAELLKPRGYEVARRTVAKYRQMLGILPANLRGRELARQSSRL